MTGRRIGRAALDLAMTFKDWPLNEAAHPCLGATIDAMTRRMSGP
jgi:hypothetical protein